MQSGNRCGLKFQTRQLLGGEKQSFDVDYWQVPKIFFSQSWRVLAFTSLTDWGGRSHIFSIDLDKRLRPIVSTLKKRLGPSSCPGTFDDEVMPADVVNTSQGAKLLYSGWNSRNTVPYHNSTGLADLDESGNIVRFGYGPVMERNWKFLSFGHTDGLVLIHSTASMSMVMGGL